MKRKNLVLLILPMLLLSGCWLYHGDPPKEYESAYYTFVNETDSDISIDCYKSRSPNARPPYKVSRRIKIPAGEETSILYNGDKDYMIFRHYSELYVWKNYKSVMVRRNSEYSLFSKDSYEKTNISDAKADFKYTYRFTEEFFKKATSGIPDDLEDPDSVVGGD